MLKPTNQLHELIKAVVCQSILLLIAITTLKQTIELLAALCCEYNVLAQKKLSAARKV